MGRKPTPIPPEQQEARRPDGRATRWANVSPERRSEHMNKLGTAAVRARRARRIAELIEAAPPLTAEQKARLSVLLNNHPEVAA